MAIWMFVFVGLISCVSLAQNNTPDYYKCNNPIGGNWLFGIAPKACDGEPFGEDRYVDQHFPHTVFQLNANESVERNRYMQEMYSLLKGTFSEYLRMRKSPTEEELNHWVDALLALVHQESFWSHYRQSESSAPVKHMRGDVGHGHGIMQVDDRWHFLAVENGQAWHLIDNITYALDIFYSGWQRAENVSCVSNGNWIERTRAAYSSYNGGSSSICRFKDTGHKWYRNDEAYYEKYEARSWERYVANLNGSPKTPYSCHLHQSPCEGEPETPPDEADPPYDLAHIAIYGNGTSCLEENGKRQCQTSGRNNLCFHALVEPSQLLEVINVSDSEPSSENTTYVNIQNLCDELFEDQVAPIDTYVKLKKNIYLRKSPGGEAITVLANDSIQKVQDRIWPYDSSAPLYYGFTYEGQLGYMYAGDKNSYSEWTTLTDPPAEDPPHPDPEPDSLYQLADNIYYEKLSLCDQGRCQSSDIFVYGPKLENLCRRVSCKLTTDTFKIIERNDEQVQVQLTKNNKTGWLSKSLVVETSL